MSSYRYSFPLNLFFLFVWLVLLHPFLYMETLFSDLLRSAFMLMLFTVFVLDIRQCFKWKVKTVCVNQVSSPKQFYLLFAHPSTQIVFLLQLFCCLLCSWWYCYNFYHLCFHLIRSLGWPVFPEHDAPINNVSASYSYKSNNNQGRVVQSVVSLTSSLRDISLTVLADSIYNILIFFPEKMWVAFAKATQMQKLLTFFQQKISAYLRITRCKF